MSSTKHWIIYTLFSLSAVVTTSAAFNIDFRWMHERQAALNLYSSGDYAAAVKALDEAAAGAPDDANRIKVQSLAALAVAHTGDYDAAMERAVALDDTDYRRYTELMVLAIQDASAVIVERFADEAINSWPERIRARAFQTRGEAYQSVGNKRAAIADFENAFSAEGASESVQLTNLNRIAGLHSSLDQNEQAEAAYLKIIDLCGDDPRSVRGSHVIYPRALLAIASIRTGEGKYAEAIAVLAPYNPDWSVSMGLAIIQTRAEIYRKWGKPEKALQIYQEGLEFAEQRKAHSRAPAFITSFNQAIAELGGEPEP